MKVNQIVKIAEAIKSVEEVKLDFKISYRLGRLLDKCESIVKNYQKQEMKLREEFAEKYNNAPEEEKVNVNHEFAVKISEMLELEEELNIPKFELKDFEGKVPVKFFTAFGDYINE